MAVFQEHVRQVWDAGDISVWRRSGLSFLCLLAEVEVASHRRL